MVLAAASLQDALGAAADAWEERGNPRPVLSFAGTSSLARQAEAGAPADLFVSADERWLEFLAARGLIRPETRVDLLTNDLVLVAPAGARSEVVIAPGFDLAAALGDGRLAVADPEAVPAGRYARQSLRTLKAWDGVSDRLAVAENVRAALALVARGEAPLGVVYRTDALAEDAVRIVDRFPPASHAPIVYPAAVLFGSESPDAKRFLDFLASGEGRVVLQRYGFGAP